MSAALKHGPGYRPTGRAEMLTFVAHRKGGWVCDCDCGERSFLTHTQIYNQGHCGCLPPPEAYGAGEVTLQEIGDELGITRERVRQLVDRAETNFRRNWELWRLVMDTDLDKADRPTLWSVVCACRILGRRLDARAPQA